MNLLLINYEYPPLGGGAATACQALAREFAALGHPPVVLTSAFDELPRSESSGGVEIVRVPALRRRADRGRILEMGAFILNVRRQLPEIVDRHKPGGSIAFFSIPGGPVAHFAWKRWGIPYVVSLRGGDVPGAESGISAVHTVLRPWRRAILSGARAIVANSEGLRQMAGAADPFPVHVIPNGVDTDSFSPPDSRQRKPGPFRFLFVGRFQTQKNLPVLLDAFAAVAPEFPGLELHLVGDGPLADELKRQAHTLGIHPHWHGWTSRSALAAQYRNCHCLVNPSLYEGMPNAVLEAMACGLPVIASDVPGNRDLVDPGRTGLRFELSSPGALAGCLRATRADPATAAVMGCAGREKVAAHFSWKSTAEQYIRLFQCPDEQRDGTV